MGSVHSFKIFGLPSFERVLHHRDDALHAGDEIHRAAGAFDHLAGDHPIRDVAFVGHFECAKNGEIDVAAANHREGIGAREKGRAGHRRDGLFAGIDQVGVDVLLGRERADAEQAVLGLQGDVHAFGNVVGHQRRDADAEIDVVAVAQLLRRAFRHQLADRIFFLGGRAALHGAELDPLLVFFSLDDAIDEDARRVDLSRDRVRRPRRDVRPRRRRRRRSSRSSG